MAEVMVDISLSMQHKYEDNNTYLNVPVFHKAEMTIDIVHVRQEGQEIIQREINVLHTVRGVIKCLASAV